jgi:hypothetical protein
MYSKVRLLLATMEIDTTDARFTTTKRYDPNSAPTSVQYAFAEGCSGIGNTPSSFGNVDLSGTPFQVSDTFILTDLLHNGYANAGGTWGGQGTLGPYPVSGQVVNFGIAGSCAGVRPANPTRLKVAFQ